MNYSKKEIILSVALCLLPILLGLYWWEELPEMVATHFNFKNEPNGWSSKTFAVFCLPCVMAALDAVCIIGLSLDPKSKRQAAAMQRLMLWFIPALSCVLMPTMLLMALGWEIDLGFYITLFMGILFIVIGNYLPKSRQNYTMGIKLPWTLNDEDNWNYTHRIGGFVWVIGGIVIVACALLGVPVVMFPVVIVMVAVPTVASFRYYRRKKNSEEEEK